jgi:hypothetical protein
MRRPLRWGLCAAAACLVFLGGAGASAAGDRVSDPVGDGSPDIVGVTTTVSGDEVILEFEFAEEYIVGRSTLGILFMGSESPCDPYASTSGIGLPAWDRSGAGLVFPDPSSDSGWVEPSTALDYRVDGPRVTIRLPRTLIEHVDLRFTAYAGMRPDPQGAFDYFPDRRGDISTCHEVRLLAIVSPSPASASPDPSDGSGRSSGSGPWVVPGLIGLLVVAVAFYVLWRTTEHRSGGTKHALPTGGTRR